MTEYHTIHRVELRKGPSGTMIGDYDIGDMKFTALFSPGRLDNMLQFAKDRARERYKDAGCVELVIAMNGQLPVMQGLPAMDTYVVISPTERGPDSGGAVGDVARYFAKLFSATELCLVGESWVVSGKKDLHIEGPVRLHPDRKSAVILTHECPRSHPLPQMYSAFIDDKKKTLGDWVSYNPGGEGNFVFLLPPSAYPQAGGKA